MISLAAGDYRLESAPARGGAILRFDWRGMPLMRPVCGPSIFDTACFPLVPFSNRIAHGRFTVDGHEVHLVPNFPGAAHPHPLHGFGWLASWLILERGETHCLLEHCHPAGEWPWAYTARQRFELDNGGLTIGLEITNDGDGRMPAGLGFHPYFLRDADTIYEGLHKGEWHTGRDGLPLSLDKRSSSIDWWDGRPVGTRVLDTVYADREGELRITWPTRALGLSISPCAALNHTVIYVPSAADFFCVEPVSHSTDALNSAQPHASMSWLEPSGTLSVAMRLEAFEIA